MSTRRIIPLSEVEQTRRDEIITCLYCYCPKHPKQVVKAVAAVESTLSFGKKVYYGICGNHAEVYPLTEEEEKRKPMLCIHCNPR